MPTKERYWQIGSGRGERDYSRECLDYGIAFVGEQYREDVEGIRVGDRIILRRVPARSRSRKWRVGSVQTLTATDAAIGTRMGSRLGFL
jgi:hypothetical protein